MEHIDESRLQHMPVIPADGRMMLDPQQLKSHRLRLGLSQEALAEHCFNQRLCVSIASIKRAESGKSILYRTARHLATAYDVSLETLILTPPLFTKETTGQLASDAARLTITKSIKIDDEESISRSVVVLALPLGVTLTLDQRTDAEYLSVQFGGVPTVVSGIEWVSVFGLPRAYGSDTARCLDCALAITQRINDVCSVMLVGLGEWREGLLHLPKSFESLNVSAANGFTRTQILVEKICSTMVSDQFNFDAIIGNDQDSSFVALRLDSVHMEGPYSPLVGRFAQLQQFKTILDEAQSNQCGQFVHIRGVAGIGKSRLLREFRDVARHWGFECYEIAFVDFGASTHRGPWGQLVSQLLGLSKFNGTEAHAALSDKILCAQLDVAQDMQLRALLSIPLSAEHSAIFDGMQHETRRRCTIEALQALLLRAAITTPVVVLIEDLHWADVSFREIFVRLLPFTCDAAIMWITTSRYENDPLDMHIRPHSQDLPLTVFDLPPLRMIEAEALALQHRGVNADHRRKCIARARGNSLFLKQLLLSPPERDLPDSLRHLIQVQLDRLPPADRRALRVASTIGQQFSLKLLREMLDNPDYSPEQPEYAHFLKPPIADDCSFVHDLVMQCIYESIPSPQRLYLHERLASYYWKKDTVLWARHLNLAEDIGAPGAYICAIREQLNCHAYSLVIELVEECFRIRNGNIDRYTLEMLAAEAAVRMMKNEDARIGYERARDLASTPRAKLEAILGIAATLNILDRTEEEDILLDDAFSLAREVGSETLTAQLLYLKGNIRFPRGQITAGRQFHEQALRHARAGGAHNLEALSLSGLGDSLYAEGRMGQAHAVFSDCLIICRQHQFASIEASNLFMLGTTRIYLGRAEEALVDSLDSAALGQRVGNRRAEIVSRLTASWVLLSMGRFDEARNHVEEGLQLARSMGAVRFEPFLGECLARLSFLDGRRSLAKIQIIEACEAMERLNLQAFIGPWLLGTLALLNDDTAVRRTALERGSEILGKGCVAHNRYRFYVAAAEIALLDGDVARATSEIMRLKAATDDDPCEWVDHHVRLVHTYGRWLTNPCDDMRVDLYELHRHSIKRGIALATPRLDASIRSL